MHLSPTGDSLRVLYRMTVALLFGLIAANVAVADCDDYYAKSGASPGATDCMAKCTTGQTSLGTFSCPNHCDEHCGSARDPCDLQTYREEWDRPDGVAPVLSDDMISYLREVGERILAEGPSAFLAARGIRQPPGVITPLVTNQADLQRILEAESDRERAEASFALYFSVALGLIPGDHIDRLRENWFDYLDMVNQPDGVDRYNQYRSAVDNAGAECGGSDSGLPPYQEPEG